MRMFGREPALWINVIAAALTLFVTFGIGVTADNATAIVATLTAGAGVLTALQTRPWSVGLFNGFIGALAVLIAGYGFDVSAEQVAAVQLVVGTVLTLIARGQIEPKPEPVPVSAQRLRNQL